MTQPLPAVLLVDDHAAHAEALAAGLEALSVATDIASGGKEALDKLAAKPYDLVITDLVMSDLDGMEVLREAKGRSPDVEVIVVTGYATVENAVAAMQQGAATYLRKPVNLDELRAVVRGVLEKQSLRRTNVELRRELDQRFGFEGIVGNHPKMLRLIETLRQIAPTDATVLVYGESGTGKELVARALHNNSPRRPKRFVALNCAALSEGILESELFGHEKGSFTGAAAARVGRFEYADGGTLLLDEVGQGAPVVASGHQAAFCQALGLRVVATFTGGDEQSIARLSELLERGDEAGVRLVVANLQEGPQLAEPLAQRFGARPVVFSNFPSMAEEQDTFDELVESNVRALTDGAAP